MKNRLLIALVSAASLLVSQAHGMEAEKAKQQLEAAKVTAALAKVMAKKETDADAKQQHAALAKKADGAVAQRAQAIQDAQADAKKRQAELNDPLFKFSAQPKMAHDALLKPNGGTLGAKKPAKVAQALNAGKANSLKPMMKFAPKAPAKKAQQLGQNNGASNYSANASKPKANGSSEGGLSSAGQSDSGDEMELCRGAKELVLDVDGIPEDEQ